MAISPLHPHDEHAATVEAVAEATRLSMEEARRLAEVMKDKLYLTDEELRTALAREAEEAKKAKPGERRTAAARDTTTAQDDASARDITEAPRPTSVGADPEGTRREAVTPVISGIGAVATAAALGDEGQQVWGHNSSDKRSHRLPTNPNDIDPHSLPLEAHSPNSAREADRALIQQMLDHARVARAGDRGDQAAADRVIAAIGSGASLASVMQQYTYLQNAEKVGDTDITLRRRGRTVHVSQVDDGDGSPDVDIEVSGGGESLAAQGSAGYGRRGRNEMTSAATTLGAILGGGDSNRSLRQLIPDSMNMSGFDPFKLTSPQTPAQEQREQGLFLA